MSDVEPLPPGSRLLHIGPHKTGTTTVQHAFYASRDALGRQGVHYPGPTKHPMIAAMAASTGARLASRADTASGRWSSLLEEVRAAGPETAVVSSEFFCEADEEHLRDIVHVLGGERVHVVVTLRPLVRILASQWQQFMQNRLLISYPDWLDAMLRHRDDTDVTPAFWRRHRHDDLVRRWAGVVGRENLTVVAVDQDDPGMLLRTFECLVGVEPGTLAAPNLAANRSLTYPEVEMVRAFNVAYRARGFSEADYTRLVRFGAVRHLLARTPPSSEERLLTPRWAVDEACSIAAEMARGIADTGVRVVGDLGTLSDPGRETAIGENLVAPEIPVDLAACFAAGVVEALASLPAKPARKSRAVGPIEAAVRRRVAPHDPPSRAS